MAVLKRQFYYWDKQGDEGWYFLAKDTETGAVFIEYEWDQRGPDKGTRRLEIGEFLSRSRRGTEHSELLTLIGTLITPGSDDA